MADDVKPEQVTWRVAVLLIGTLVIVAGAFLGMNYLQNLAAGCLCDAFSHS